MKYEVIVSDRAKQMLLAHIKFLAKVSKAGARATKNRIINGIRSLSEMPNRFPFLNKSYLPRNKYHKMFIEDRYLVIFQIQDSTVFVDYIIDCRQDYKWLLE